MLRIVALKGLFAFAAVASLGFLGGCSQYAPDYLKPLSLGSTELLAEKEMQERAPILVRVFKDEAELEIWKQKADGHFALFKTYPICRFSGHLGPKLREGDRQSPEGFYSVAARQMNPHSRRHLAFNVGYPNAYDRAHGRTGSNIMVHGGCSSIGCFAMTDEAVEEIFTLSREALAGGQESFQVQSYPFRMSDANMEKHKGSKWFDFWKTLKEGYDYFETTRLQPNVKVCDKKYLINTTFVDPDVVADPRKSCPAYRHLPVIPYEEPQIAEGDGQSAPLPKGPAAKPLGLAMGSSFGTKPDSTFHIFSLGPAVPNPPVASAE
ncbi:murein L,D-transpeptidase family protein [Methyloligella sp. 2.7D]|uniref:L,D-transpeptidase family protein n=1 Tax=unclassified Methyloligella TaxID=2625955 RepID=UPI00157D4048|nr:murein L,D-transpeptidase [Methyloligella sp. GL2]